MLPSVAANTLWAALPADEQDLLAPDLRSRFFTRGDVLIVAHDAVATLYFPIDAKLADVMVLADGRASCVSSVGRQGVAGLAGFLAEEPLAWNVEVHVGGLGYALPAAALRRRLDENPALLTLFNRSNHERHVEAAQNAACAAAGHSALSRVARWLLIAQDCTGSAAIRISQEEVARHLSLRRTTVTAAAAALKSAGACSYLRERIVIERRDLLQSYACDCYRDLSERRIRAPAEHVA